MSEALPDITKLRTQLGQLVAPLPGRVHVTLAPSDYGRNRELNFLVTIIVGPPGDETEEAVDRLYEEVPKAVELDAQLGAFVSKCSGHRMYASGPDQPPEMGAEWTVKVLT